LGKFLASAFLYASCSHTSNILNAGGLPYRSSISIDRFLKPLSVMTPNGTESSASALLRGKRMRRGDDGNGSDRAEGEDLTSEEEAHKVEEDAVRLGC
jgi:hypothetical protein